jgi:hypothetical protein
MFHLVSLIATKIVIRSYLHNYEMLQNSYFFERLHILLVHMSEPKAIQNMLYFKVMPLK